MTMVRALTRRGLNLVNIKEGVFDLEDCQVCKVQGTTIHFLKDCRRFDKERVKILREMNTQVGSGIIIQSTDILDILII